LTLHAVEDLADRIERAYLRRQPYWRQGCSNPQVWASAAVTLIRLHRTDPTIPLDPELYVAAQPLSSPLADPWEDLAQASSAKRYRRRVRQIIRMLRMELQDEVRHAEDLVTQGESISVVLTAKSRSLSPLGRYIVAYRAGRLDLAGRCRSSAQAQHRSCPLYRHASRELLPRKAYPVLELASGLDFPSRAAEKIPLFSLN